MSMDIRTPPTTTGWYKRDIANIREWCEMLRRKVQQMLTVIRDEQIESVSADKLRGTIDPTIIQISGGNITFDGETFSISNEDGSQYIKFEGGEVYICGHIVNLDETEAAEVTA